MTLKIKLSHIANWTESIMATNAIQSDYVERKIKLFHIIFTGWGCIIID